MSEALVSVRNPDTRVLRTAKPNAAGFWQLSGMSAGRYDIEIASPGFASSRQTGIELRVGDELRADAVLSAAGRRDTVEVRDQMSLTQTAGAAVSTVVGNTAVEELPLNGRQLQNLALLVPGVSGGWNLSTAANRYGKARENTEGAFNVNGIRSRSNNFVVDGMPMNVLQYNVINFEPSNEAVREFEVKTTVPAAEFGRTMGGTVNIVTNSGSSRLHGVLYEFFRNDRLDANNTFNNRSGLSRGRVRQNQFGGSLGGPIWKEKHFFFVNTELLRNVESSETRLTAVPSADEQRGVLRFIGAGGTPQLLDLSSRITPLSRKLLDLYPAPNSSGASGLNYNAPLTIALNDYQYHARSDHHFSPSDIVTARTSWNLNDQQYIINRFGGPFVPGFSLPNPERTINATIGYLRTIGSGAVSEARLGVNRYGNDLANGDPRNATEFGLPHGASANGIPSISFSSGGLEMLGGQPWFNREQNEVTVFGSEAISLLSGTHSMKFGGNLSRYHFNTRGANNQRGTLVFDGSRSGLIPRTSENLRAAALTDLYLGLPQQASITVGQFGRGYRQWAWSLYAQDTWRATRNLTLSYGIRYEYAAPWTEVNDKLANFLPGSGLVTPQSAGWKGLYRPDRNNLAPRAGLAWDITGSGRTVIRAGFAALHETLLQASTVQQIENNPPYSASAITFAPVPFAQDSSPSNTLLQLRTSALPSRSLSAVPVDLRNPYTIQYSFDLQHEFARSWIAEAGYRGTRGVRLPLNYNINQVSLLQLTQQQRDQIADAGSASAAIVDSVRPFRDFSAITLFDNAAVSSYHALQLKLERRFNAGISLLAAYTLSKSIDNASDFGSGDSSERVLNSYDLRRQRGLSSFDIPHRFTSALSCLLPSPSGWARGWLGGWQVNGIITVQSGQPFTPFTSAFDPFRNENYNRLDVVGDLLAGRISGAAYNPNAFRAPSPGTFGNSGRNVVRGDGYRSADLSLFRIFKAGEQMRIQLRFEAINAFNNVNYQGPVTNQSTTPGLFVASAPPRQVQLGVRLSF